MDAMSRVDSIIGDAELIAAFLDAKLSPHERLGLLERLDLEEALYEVFLESARFRLHEYREQLTSMIDQRCLGNKM